MKDDGASGHEPWVEPAPAPDPAAHLDAGTLFRAHARFVATFLARLGVTPADLDDAVQEVFIVALRRGGFVEGPAEARTWLAAIALRTASDARRRVRRREAALASIVDVSEESTVTPFESASASELLARVQRALDTLRLEHRAVFLLYEIEGASCESIAAGMGVPVGTVYSRLHAARRGFKDAHDRIEAEEQSTSKETA